MLQTGATNNQAGSGAAVAQLAAMAWCDGLFAEKLKTGSRNGIQDVCSDLGIPVDTAIGLRGKLAESPVGDVPFEGPSFVMATTEASCATDDCGTWYSMTAECGCSDTWTGDCSCFSIWGTMCWTCS